MEIVIVGLGLIGGSVAKALKQNTAHRVLGMDADEDALLDACSCGAIDGKASLSDLERADLVYLALYPQDILAFVRRYGGKAQARDASSPTPAASKRPSAGRWRSSPGGRPTTLWRATPWPAKSRAASPPVTPAFSPGPPIS